MVHSKSRKRKAKRQALLIEALEARTLMSITPTVATINNVFPQGGAYDSSGILWVLNVGNGLTLDKISGGAVVDSIDLSGTSPLYLAAGANGHIYMTDIGDGINSAIDDVDTVQHTVTPHSFALPNFSFPTQLTVTSSGAVWFLSNDFASTVGNVTTHTSVFGRLNPGTNALTLLTSNTFGDSEAAGISAKGSDSVWISMAAAEDTDNSNVTTFGTNRVLNASFTGSAIQVDGNFVVNPNVANGANNSMGSIAADSDGSVWFTLANNPSSARPIANRAPDMIVHANASGSVQTGYTLTNDTTSQLTVAGLQFDGSGNLWVAELTGPQAGYFNKTTSQFDLVNYPGGTENPFAIVANPGAASAVVFTAPSNPGAGSPIITLTVDQVQQPVVFSDGFSTGISGVENTGQSLAATFTGPAGVYVASVTWGDGGPTSLASVITLGADPDGGFDYAITYMGKVFATQGVYNGHITVTNLTDSNGNGAIPFTSTITDTPLLVAAPTLINTNGKFFDLNGSFTDDIDSTASWFTASVNWGDGSTSAGVIVKDLLNPGHYFVFATHHKYKKGTFDVALTVTTHDENSLVNIVTVHQSLTVT